MQAAHAQARPHARPVPGRRLPGALPSARLAARTAPEGAREIVHNPPNGTLAEIGAHKRALVVTYRRDGRPVPTPVWAAERDGLLYVRTERAAGKIKRLRADPRVLVAPCTVRGRPLGLPMQALGAVLAREQEPLAEQALKDRYGLGRALFERAMDLLRVDMCYLELTPAWWRQPPSSGPSATNDGGAIAR